MLIRLRSWNHITYIIFFNKYNIYFNLFLIIINIINIYITLWRIVFIRIIQQITCKISITYEKLWLYYIISLRYSQISLVHIFLFCIYYIVIHHYDIIIRSMERSDLGTSSLCVETDMVSVLQVTQRKQHTILTFTRRMESIH